MSVDKAGGMDWSKPYNKGHSHSWTMNLSHLSLGCRQHLWSWIGLPFVHPPVVYMKKGDIETNKPGRVAQFLDVATVCLLHNQANKLELLLHAFLSYLL